MYNYIYLSKEQYEIYQNEVKILANEYEIKNKHLINKKFNAIAYINIAISVEFIDKIPQNAIYNNKNLGSISFEKYDDTNYEFKICENNKLENFMNTISTFTLKFYNISDGCVYISSSVAYDANDNKLCNFTTYE